MVACPSFSRTTTKTWWMAGSPEVDPAAEVPVVPVALAYTGVDNNMRADTVLAIMLIAAGGGLALIARRRRRQD